MIQIDDNIDKEVEENAAMTEYQAVNEIHVDKGVLNEDQTNETWRDTGL